jgi:Domain of unknown function (DUF4349)
MRRRSAPDPAAARELAAIDAALAGGPVGAEEADLAQLATLLVAERPQPDPAFRARLDAQVQARFAGEAGAADPPRAAASRRAGRPRRRLPLLPAFAGTGLAAVVAVLLAVSVTGGGGAAGVAERTTGGAVDAAAGGASDAAAPERAPATGGQLFSDAPPAADADGGEPGRKAQSDALQYQRSAGSAASAPPAVGSSSSAPKPLRTEARKVERSSTVELGAPADRVDDVAQGVLGVVARNGGIVDESTVATRAGGGEASFQLRIPAARLQAALAQLSRLPDALVLSRTDDTLDVNQAYVSVRRRLEAAEARRSGLLRALRATADRTEADRLTAEVERLDTRIAQLQRSQRALDRRIDYSRVALTVRADDGAGAGADDDGGGGFGLGSAFDDAGRLLAVTAGIAVIAAAALVPLALVAACAWPLARALRRRRREQALDAA